MNNQLKNLFKLGILVIGISLSLTNCEKETVIEKEVTTVESQTPKLSIKHLSKDVIDKNARLHSKLESFTSKLYEEDENLSQKGGEKYIKEYDFIIDTESATYVQEGDYHSYTFPIIQSKKQNIKNVLFSLNDENEYDSYLVEYSYTYAELNSLDESQLSKRTKMSPINLDFNSLTARPISYHVCFYSYELVDTGDLMGEGNEVYEWVLTASDCDIIWGTNDYGDDYYTSTVSTDPTTGNPSYSGSGSLITSPTLSNMYDESDIIMFGMLKTNLDLNISQYDWLIHNYTTAKAIFDFLGQNLVSTEAKTEAKMTILAEIANDNRAPKWDYSKTGTFPNRPALKYNAAYNPNLGETMYLLENGLVLYQSATKRIINKKVPNSIASTEQSTHGFNYIYRYDTKRWYEYRLPKETFADADIDFLITAFWDGAKIVGRYATPLEEAMVLIDGKDFDNVEQNKAINAGVLILGFIPGGKVLKPIGKGTGKVWKVVIKKSDKVFSRTIKELTEETLQHFDEFAPGTRNLIDEALRKGEFLDDQIIIEVGEEIADISAKKGRKLTWTEVKALFKRGQDFNEKARGIYKYNEVTLKNGKRLDSYKPGQEIISRKATTLADIKPETFKSYLHELINKYPKGAEINAPKFGNLFKDKILDGDYYLEIPLSNKVFFENSTIFQQVLTQFNVDNNVLIRIKYLAE